MLKTGEVILFDSKKYFKYVKPLGSGGTGDTHLFEDETTNALFAIKKYAPKFGNDIEENYDRFVQEVKILFSLSHKNIVRIYSHYLYPEHKIGYLQMEHVEGSHIDNFTPYVTKNWNDIFFDIVEAFSYLEKNKILHRDIRAANILIDANGTAKIIDFGFGKKLSTEASVDNSVVLNWPVSSPPKEVITGGIYNHQTEIFFLGKLFSSIGLKSDSKFRYGYILDKMCEYSPNDRYKSFFEVASDISTGEFVNLDFTQAAKRTYQEFASSLVGTIAHFKDKLVFERDSQKILSALADAIRVSCFEDFFQDHSKLISSFVKQKYSYYDPPKESVNVGCAREFFELFSKINERERQVLLENLQVRLDKVKIQTDNLDDVPF